MRSTHGSKQFAAAAEDRRYHSLDQLRAVMMLLGLVIHSTVSFVTRSRGAAWPYQDASTSVLFDILVDFIHVFRMPLFFLMAGFFTALLYYRRGAWEMVRNRGARVAIPFVLSLAVLFPLVRCWPCPWPRELPVPGPTVSARASGS